nr:hypothetical protein [Pseudomonas aegrilactucae]
MSCRIDDAARAPRLAGYHLYYPNRREHSSAFGVVVDALRYSR